MQHSTRREGSKRDRQPSPPLSTVGICQPAGRCTTACALCRRRRAASPIKCLQRDAHRLAPCRALAPPLVQRLENFQPQLSTLRGTFVEQTMAARPTFIVFPMQIAIRPVRLLPCVLFPPRLDGRYMSSRSTSKKRNAVSPLPAGTVLPSRPALIVFETSATL
ncbi:hypothetical protein LX36DRAFT_301315 [Colletotrichum falcatum]|nr:hypothetical protein LX36DRAFT_301315 [Colletotrichum falcatum]